MAARDATAAMALLDKAKHLNQADKAALKIEILSKRVEELENTKTSN